MDSPASRKPPQLLNRCCGSTLLTSLLAVVGAVFSVAFLAIPFGKESVGPPIEVPSRCKIVSSRVTGKYYFDCGRAPSSHVPLTMRESLGSKNVSQFVWGLVNLWLATNKSIFAFIEGRGINLESQPLISKSKGVVTSVDLRSSKVCELGLLNFNAKHVFYPSERKKFRCRYDYYWASVFKVEYKDHFSGQISQGLAEAPKEALPLDCRPSFATAMLTKYKFKVNESYDCWYASGLSKIEIYQDDYFGCQGNDPSAVEMIRRYYILSTRMLNSWLSRKKMPSELGWGLIVGTTSGFFSSLIWAALFKMIQPTIFWFLRVTGLAMGALFHRLVVGRALFLLAYFSIVGWLTIEYGKRLGIPLLLKN